MSAPWKEQARAMREAGHRVSDIAACVGRDHATVWRAVGDIAFETPSRIAAHSAIQLPAWVRRAGLTDDFRDIAQTLGEHEAAAHCRRLTVAMRAEA